ncbi:MAG: bifunctional 23S rRNA (guanine(2069)-N(7))-methyltransferase RlmK/23S rRNA (guanine(2445)-N(2))-methyltransferase RlmL [Atopobiaceae bacterium]|nr:bifunctional 23S rRNA (guanine(2069)-N(7))-methyltransferase RlmK/23S rRNA (guanine(2445)-N(2))-methyltransferase RlmL [Olsenella sp.]MDY3901417.1 bifunctional 23S rRNA (guanine(2069)-N(7))-methyltransferase RlmK/23S rRNA (guanine(2445)-N(2))-methyltransferase RlmL [Atopobiaceae bacterium]
MNFFATCPKGFERLLAAELASLGITQVRPLKGQVSFEGGLDGAYRACLWSRLASRVMLTLARIDATDADALYAGMGSIDWTRHLAPGATFAIDAHGTNAELRNTQFTALRSKDAISDQLLARRGARPAQDPADPDLTIAVRVSRDHATVAIDLSGAPLFRRGYETARGKAAPIAPLRPDYAAALLAAGGWFRCVRHDKARLLALFPGAGTVLVEAASEALDRAPGLLRTRWGFEGWLGHDAATWEALLDEADERAEKGGRFGAAAGGAAGGTVAVGGLELVCFEGRRGSEQAATQLLRAAGIHGVRPRYLSASELGDAAQSLGPSSLIACDLSWIDAGDAAEEAVALSELARATQRCGRVPLLATIARDGAAEAAFGGPATKREAIYLGQDEGVLCTFDLAAERGERPVARLKDGREVPVMLPTSQQFADRLWKVARERRKWAKREDVSCYRVYDTDLPDYAVSIELYQGAGEQGRWLRVSEYRAPKDVDPLVARERLMDVLAIAPQVLDVAPRNVFLRVRSRAKGGSQYADEGKLAGAAGGRAGAGRGASRKAGRGASGREVLLGRGRAAGPHSSRGGRAQDPGLMTPPGAHLVEEGGLTFEVNFESRLDCGIFLDHRETRALVREMAKQTQGSKRFLNLFAYTGTATCYAADGGAKHTTTVDMSRPSLDWARRNMARNGFTGPEHEFVQADVVAWISEQRRTANRWDLVFCDVPTFSNSDRMHHGSWDVQRDHAELLIGVSRLLTRNGTCVFSCNLRSFKPDVEYLRRYGVEVEDITARTIPEDFSRNPKIHHCYLVRRFAQGGRGA